MPTKTGPDRPETLSRIPAAHYVMSYRNENILRYGFRPGVNKAAFINDLFLLEKN